MTKLALLSCSAAFLLGLVPTAEAGRDLRHPHDERAAYYQAHVDTHRNDHHRRCVGLTSGTAHRSCGTWSGGPVGGLH